MNIEFTQLPISAVRTHLPKLRYGIQMGMKRFVCTHYGRIAGFLVPLKDLDALNSRDDGIDEQKTTRLSLRDFRDGLTEAHESFLRGTDCIYLTFHRRPIIAFLSPRFSNYFQLPTIGEIDKFLDLWGGP